MKKEDSAADAKNSNDQGDSDPMFRRWLRAVLLTPAYMFLHFVAAVVVCFVSIRTVGAYRFIFENHDAELAAATISVIRFSDWMTNFWYLFFVALIFIDGPVLAALQLLPARRRWAVALWSNAIVLLSLLWIGWIVAIMALTLTHMMEAKPPDVVSRQRDFHPKAASESAARVGFPSSRTEGRFYPGNLGGIITAQNDS